MSSVKSRRQAAAEKPAVADSGKALPADKPAQADDKLADADSTMPVRLRSPMPRLSIRRLILLRCLSRRAGPVAPAVADPAACR